MLYGFISFKETLKYNNNIIIFLVFLIAPSNFFVFFITVVSFSLIFFYNFSIYLDLFWNNEFNILSIKVYLLINKLDLL